MSGRMPSASARQVVRALKNLGFERAGNKGDHWLMEKDSRVVQVPWHPNVPRGSLGLIIRQAGVSRKEFLSALK